MKKPITINVVSGKGGTGKSLLCAVLARMIAQESAKVLLVDFDIFVRGLTHFFYTFKKEKRSLTEGITVADFFELSVRQRDSSYKPEIAIEKFYEVDILPAVSEIEEEVNYLEVGEKTVEKARDFFKQVLSSPRVVDNYDYVIIDNRAGIDELIIKTSQESDVIISISESDPIARTTNDNLLRHLSSKKVGKIYTIINKAKFISSIDEYERSMETIRGDFSILGQIPFDVDLFESFGTSRFWDGANSTKYAYALAEAWNKLAKREDFDASIDMRRFKMSKLWFTGVNSPTFLGKIERLSFVFGILSIVLYLVSDFVYSQGFNFRSKDFFLLYAVVLLSLPLFRRFFGFGSK
jgi:septum site-determining protein MinD